MSSINTSSSLGIRSVIQSGKNANPGPVIRDAHPDNSSELRTGNPGTTQTDGKNATPGPVIRDAHPDNSSELRTGNPDSTHAGGKTIPDPGQSPIRSSTQDSEAATHAGSHTPSQVATAHDTAQKLVATTLIKPILAQARAARDAPAPWGQTQAEKQFGALLDNRIADDISKASSFPIAQRIADQILKNSPVTEQPTPPTHKPMDIFG